MTKTTNKHRKGLSHEEGQPKSWPSMLNWHKP